MSARILLVEDELALANLLARFLVRAGFSPSLCSTGKEALARWDSSWSAAVVDLGLPDMPGERLVMQMATAVPSSPIIVSSGTPSAEAAFAAAGPGRIHFLQKPFLPAELLRLFADLGLTS